MPYDVDIDDIWGRLRKRLLDKRLELVNAVVGGGCDLPTYQHYCGRIAQIDEDLELARSVRRGEDLRPPPAREPLRSPEE